MHVINVHWKYKSMGLHMRWKCNKIKKKSFIKDRIIKRHPVLSAELGWLLQGGQREWYCYVIFCDSSTARPSGLLKVEEWAIKVVVQQPPSRPLPSLPPFRKLLCSKEVPLPLSEALSPFNDGLMTCSVLFTSSCAFTMLMHYGKGVGLNGYGKRQTCYSLSILWKVWTLSNWSAQNHGFAQIPLLPIGNFVHYQRAVQ